MKKLNRQQRREAKRLMAKANPALRGLINTEVLATEQGVVMRFNVSTRAVSFAPDAARLLAGTLIEAANRSQAVMDAKAGEVKP